MCIRSTVSMIMRIGLVLILTASTFLFAQPISVVQAEPSFQRSIQQDGLVDIFDENDPTDPLDQTTEEQEPQLPPHLAERSEMARSKDFDTSNSDMITVMSSFYAVLSLVFQFQNAKRWYPYITVPMDLNGTTTAAGWYPMILARIGPGSYAKLGM
jgi:hypothetical protein